MGRGEGVPAGTWLVAARKNWQALTGMAALVVGLALALVAVAGFTQTRAEPAPSWIPSITARGTLSPRALLFGDPLTARIDVFVDRSRIDPDQIRLQTPFPPFVPVSESSWRRDRGGVTELRYTITLQCLTIDCLPPLDGRRYFVFPQSEVLYREPAGSGGLVNTLPIRYRAVGLESGLNAEAVRAARRRSGRMRVLEGPAAGVDLQEAASLVRDESQRQPAASYRVSPILLVSILLVLAVSLAIAAVILVVRYVRPPAPAVKSRPAVPTLSPLEHALGELDLALADGQVGRQRKALELLASELSESGDDELAGDARELAWSQGSLARDQALALARTVRQSVNGGTGGDAD